MTPLTKLPSCAPKHYNASIASLKFTNPDLMIVRVRPDVAVQPHKPGQYSTLGLGHALGPQPRARGVPGGIVPAGIGRKN